MSAFNLAFVVLSPTTIHAARYRVSAVAKVTICVAIAALPVCMWSTASWVVRKAWRGFDNA